jgi:hypothetical protein
LPSVVSERVVAVRFGRSTGSLEMNRGKGG